MNSLMNVIRLRGRDFTKYPNNIVNYNILHDIPKLTTVFGELYIPYQ